MFAVRPLRADLSPEETLASSMVVGIRLYESFNGETVWNKGALAPGVLSTLE